MHTRSVVQNTTTTDNKQQDAVVGVLEGDDADEAVHMVMSVFTPSIKLANDQVSA